MATGRHRTTRSRATLIAGVAAVVALAASCTQDWSPSAVGRAVPGADSIVELRRVGGCDDLVATARASLARTVEDWWGAAEVERSGGVLEEQAPSALPAAPSTVSPDNDSIAADAAPAEAGRSLSGGSASGSVVGTNNQERSIEEGDLVKTDGRRIVSIVDGVLRVTELDGSPAVDGEIDLSSRAATQLFLRGDTALVIGSTSGSYGGRVRVLEDSPGPDDSDVVTPGRPVEPVPPETSTTVPTTSTTSPTSTSTTSTTTTTAAPTTTTAPPEPPAPFTRGTSLTLVSLEDPTAPAVSASAEVEGDLVSARDLDGVARIVVRSTPMVMEDLMATSGPTAAEDVVAAVEESTLLPRFARNGRTQVLGDCDDVFVADVAEAVTEDRSAPIEASSIAPPGELSTVTVLSVGDDLAELAPVSVQGAADTVYAAPDALYVASGSWDTAGSRTDVHRFSLSGDGPASYTGSGRAPGRLLNQFSLSSRDGALRIVTTRDGGGAPIPIEPGTIEDGGFIDGDSFGRDAIAPAQSDARLTVLDTDGALDEIGHVDGLGVGEEVQSVRFLEDMAYVVTFRQTDPLYALDLSDPTNPTVLGELKIPGFSEYLHPLGNGLLMGVGREADPESGMDEGFKLSLFDVSDPARMVEVDRIVMPGAWSPISEDHKAFTWDPERRQAIVPVDGGCGPEELCAQELGGSALVIGVDGSSFERRGEITHSGESSRTTPIRSMIVGDDLWTLSHAALGRSDADAPDGVELLEF